MKLYRVAALPFLCLFLSVTTQAGIDDGLIAYYPLDGDARDSSVNGNDGVEMGVSYTLARDGEVAVFDGLNDTIDISLQKPSGDFSISVWLNPTSFTYYAHAIMGDGRTGESQSTDPWIWLFYRGISEDHKAGTICWNWEDTSSGNHDYLCGDEALPANRYSNVVIVREGELKKIYINGSLSGTQIDSSTPNYFNPNPITIGNFPEHPNHERHFLGSLDELRIYDRALAVEEIEELAGGIDRGLVAYYPFEGDTNDVSGNDLNAVTHGNISFVEGIDGLAASFDGSGDYLQTATLTDIWDTWTLSAYVNPDINTRHLFIVERERIGHFYDVELRLDPAGGVRVEADNSTSGSSFSSLSLVPVGEWSLVTATYDGSTIDIYIDGVLDASYIETNAHVNVAEPLLIGKHANISFPHYFEGLIDEIRIYKRALTPLEINALNSARNKTPIANAGIDQIIIASNALVTLDGTNSYDDEGDPLTFFWTLSGPSGEALALNNPETATPSFNVMGYGEYVAELIVTDSIGAMSVPDTVLVSSNNLQPVADAGVNQVVSPWTLVEIDGIASFDPNNDELTYHWRFVDTPAILTPPNITNNSPHSFVFTPLYDGDYRVGLIVNDGEFNSIEDVVTITVVSSPSAAQDSLIDLLTNINNLPDDVFSGGNRGGKQGSSNAKGHRNSFTNQIAYILKQLSKDNNENALNKLMGDSVLGKIDGCEKSGKADADDVIVDCVVQQTMYFKLLEIAKYLNPGLIPAPITCASSNVDYCGPVANPLIALLLVPDELLGPFTGACAAHDYCYFNAGGIIADYGIEKYSGGFQPDNPNNHWYFKVTKELDKNNTLPSIEKASCDLAFFNTMLSACFSENPHDIANCSKYAVFYYGGVKFLARAALEGAIQARGQCAAPPLE